MSCYNRFNPEKLAAFLSKFSFNTFLFLTLPVLPEATLHLPLRQLPDSTTAADRSAVNGTKGMNPGLVNKKGLQSGMSVQKS